MLETLIDDHNERFTLFNSIKHDPAIKRKADWALKWIENPQASFAERLVAFAAVEGIFFSSSFAAIFWVKTKAIMPGLTLSNEFISRDEGMHTDFACLLLNHFQGRPESERIKTIIAEAVDIEQFFVKGEEIYVMHHHD